MGYPVCSNRIHSSGINGPWKSLFETTKSFLGDGHRLKLFLGVWESGARLQAVESVAEQLRPLALSSQSSPLDFCDLLHAFQKP